MFLTSPLITQINRVTIATNVWPHGVASETWVSDGCFGSLFRKARRAQNFRKQMGHLRMPVLFGNAPLRGALACCALACRWWYAMIRWISAHWLLNSSLIDKFNDPSKDFRKRRGSPWPKGYVLGMFSGCF